MIDVNVCFYGCGKTRNGIDDPEFNGEDDLVCKDCRELESLIKNMDIPEFRRHDRGWLQRNLPFNNSEHPDFPKAWELLNDKLCEATWSLGGCILREGHSAHFHRDPNGHVW
jgi:hypothetical protein